MSLYQFENSLGRPQLQPMYEDGKNLSWFSSCNKLQMSLYYYEKSLGCQHSPVHV
jgi:hypothetical protein